MPNQITVEALYPYLTDRQISEEQLSAFESELQALGAVLTLTDGTATLLHVDVVLKALKAIDGYPWKDESAVEFRRWLAGEIRSTGILYWIVGADTLPLKEV
jgi:hypothetical protein